MNQSLNRIALAAALGTGLLATTGASAQSAGSLMLRLGATQIKPNVSSGDLTAPSFAGTQVDIRSNTQLGGGLTYMLTDNLAIDVPLVPGRSRGWARSVKCGPGRSRCSGSSASSNRHRRCGRTSAPV